MVKPINVYLRLFMLQISPAALAQIADYFKVFSEVSRLQIVCCLKSGSKNVTEIMVATGLGQANVSKHLKILTQAGIITRKPQGGSVFYQIADPLIFKICEQVCDSLSIRFKEQSQKLKQLEALHKR